MSAARTPLATSIAASTFASICTSICTSIFASIFIRGLICALGATVAGCSHPAQAPLIPLPRPVFADYLAGKLSAYQGDWDTAADAVGEAAAAAPDQPMIAVELARLQMKAKRTADAVAT